jgi:hypothetical protein
MANHLGFSKRTAAKAAGIGLMAGGLLLGAPAGMAFAQDTEASDTTNQVSGFLGFAVGSLNDAAQYYTELNNEGLQNGVASLNDAAQAVNPTLQDNVAAGNEALQDNVAAGNSALQSTVTSANGLVKFAVQGLLR